MKLLIVSFATFLSALAPCSAAEPPARSLVRQALAAQGGEQKLRALRAIAFDGSGYRNMLEQSERPEGPYLLEFVELSEYHDLTHHGLRRHSESKIPPNFEVAQTLIVADGIAAVERSGATNPGRPVDVTFAAERMALSPERLLLTALDAADLRQQPDETLHGVVHHVLGFTLDGAPVRVFLNGQTSLPFAYEYSGPLVRNGMYGYLGDVTERVSYSMWWLDKSGVRFPLQWNSEVNGMPANVMQLRNLRVDALDETLTRIAPEVRARFNPAVKAVQPADVPLGRPGQPPVELAPGIVQIPGGWNTAIVDQGDGLVIIEAPVSSAYSAKVLDEAARRFPGKPVKAVITTSDSWPHLAGVREYAGRGIRIYALDLNEPIIRRTLAASYTVRPDALTRTPKPAQLELVGGKTVVGSGPNRIELYPIRGATSERQMMAYFPAHRLLYGSDPFQKNQDGSYFLPQPVTELRQAVARERIGVDKFFMMHMGLTPYAELATVPGVQP